MSDSKSITLKSGICAVGLFNYLERLQQDRDRDQQKQPITLKQIVAMYETGVLQGVWTAASLYAEHDRDDSLKMVQQFGCKLEHLHENDAERMIEAFGSNKAFQAAFIDPNHSSIAVMSLVKKYTQAHQKTDLSSNYLQTAFSDGINDGAKICAQQIAIVSRPIADSIAEYLEIIGYANSPY